MASRAQVGPTSPCQGVHSAAESGPGASPSTLGIPSHLAGPRILVPTEGNSSQCFRGDNFKVLYNNLGIHSGPGPDEARPKKGTSRGL